MPSSIWTPAALSSEARPYQGLGWRLVEAQHHVSTMKLVDTPAEQDILESLIEATKPSIPPECRHLDYLLATPFRYGPAYPQGSRFRRAGFTPGVLYAAETQETALAEMAFYRLLFYAESPQTPWPANAAEYTAFCVPLATQRSLDLTLPPLSAEESQWTGFSDYGACQRLAEDARAAGVTLIRYQSVRDSARRANLAVLSCMVFAARQPVNRETWRIMLGENGVQAVREFPLLRIGFGRDAFSGDPRLADLRWVRQAK